MLKEQFDCVNAPLCLRSQVAVYVTFRVICDDILFCERLFLRSLRYNDFFFQIAKNICNTSIYRSCRTFTEQH